MGGDGRSWERLAAAALREGEGSWGRHGREGLCGGGGGMPRDERLNCKVVGEILGQISWAFFFLLLFSIRFLFLFFFY
jgi:hypothetical protein